MKKSELKEIIKECVREVMSKEPLQEASKYRTLQNISIRGKNNEFAIGETGLSGKTMFSCEIGIQRSGINGYGKSEQEAIDNAVKKAEERIQVLQDLKKKLSSMKPKKLEESGHKKIPLVKDSDVKVGKTYKFRSGQMTFGKNLGDINVKVVKIDPAPEGSRSKVVTLSYKGKEKRLALPIFRNSVIVEASYKPSKPKWYKDNMPVVIVGLKTGVERYKNFADAKRKHKDLELYDASKKSRFTTAMYDKDKGKEVARFETWEAYNRMSM
jgi:hypothetical protein